MSARVRLSKQTRYRANHKGYKYNTKHRPSVSGRISAYKHTSSVVCANAPRARDLPKRDTYLDREVQEIERSIIAIKRA